MTFTPLVLAVPSKGRLKAQFDDFMERADMPIKAVSGRGYSGYVKGISDMEVRYLSASEIARHVAAGDAHLGVTGRDLVEELIAGPFESKSPTRITGLGFGFANVVVAVPQSWIDVTSMTDLVDVSVIMSRAKYRQLRVATKYGHLTRQFFDKHGLNAYRVIESLGATEGAPQAGSADIIVDITTTGATLAANRLKTIGEGTILSSEAFLYASRMATFSSDHRLILRNFLDRLEARLVGSTLREIKTCLKAPSSEITRLVKHYRAHAPWPFQSIADDDSLYITLHAKADVVADLVASLREIGAGAVTVSRLMDYYDEDASFFRDLAPKLPE